MGDFNPKIGEAGERDCIGPYDLGERNHHQDFIRGCHPKTNLKTS